MKENLYYYRAVVVSVYDGDTCTVDIDLGLNTWVRGEKLRLYRINAPELRGPERPEGLKSRDFLREQRQAQFSAFAVGDHVVSQDLHLANIARPHVGFNDPPDLGLHGRHTSFGTHFPAQHMIEKRQNIFRPLAKRLQFHGHNVQQ